MFNTLISKIRSALGGTLNPGWPLSPYAYFDGISIRALSPSHMDATPSSHPGITIPFPDAYLKGWGYFAAVRWEGDVRTWVSRTIARPPLRTAKQKSGRLVRRPNPDHILLQIQIRADGDHVTRTRLHVTRSFLEQRFRICLCRHTVCFILYFEGSWPTTKDRVRWFRLSALSKIQQKNQEDKKSSSWMAVWILFVDLFWNSSNFDRNEK